ncbi:MAG: sulfatase-like hydrolase/transferase [Lewinella sp.]
MRYCLFCLLLLSTFAPLSAQQTHPNLLLIIADDLGVDRLKGYHDGALMATTPTLDSLRNVGITFTNAFAAPVCSPTRAAIMSGKYGVNNGVGGVPGNLDLVHTSVFKELDTRTNSAYADAVIGKWHLSQPVDNDHPNNHGADHFMGVMEGSPGDYSDWTRVENGVSTQSTEYVTTALTDGALDWVNDQTQPWFLWLAHPAPHSPFHVPPAGLFTIENTDSEVNQYIAMVESVDHEINRLLNGLSDSVRANTLIIFVGDNGTPRRLMQDYPDGRGKGTLYQGGVRVPFIVSGAGVTRQGEREDALVHLTDIHATLLEVAGADLPGGIYNSHSFAHLLSLGSTEATRDYNYTEVTSGNAPGWTIRNRRYKLIDFENGRQEFYNLEVDSFELADLLSAPLSDEAAAAKSDLETEAAAIRNGWSCRDHIQNGTETGIDCGTDACGTCTTSTTQINQALALELYPNPVREQLTVSVEDQVIEAVRVFDGRGRLLTERSGNQTRRVTLNVGDLKARLLLVEVTTAEGVAVKKVVKQH